jgi:hypothetical protein
MLLNVTGKTEVKDKETIVQEAGLQNEIWNYEPQHARCKLKINKQTAEETKYKL